MIYTERLSLGKPQRQQSPPKCSSRNMFLQKHPNPRARRCPVLNQSCSKRLRRT
jgi:hypothetical protein